MTDIMKSIDAAFKLVSSIPVTGQDVETMAAVRQHLRRAYSSLEQLRKQATEPKQGEEGRKA